MMNYPDDKLSAKDAERLSAYLDGMLDEPERIQLEQELAENTLLQAELEALQATVALINDLPELTAPRDFRLTPQMLAPAEAPPAARPEPKLKVLPRKRKRRPPWLSIGSAAAVIVLAMGFFAVFLSNNNEPITQQSDTVAFSATQRAAEAEDQDSIQNMMVDPLPTSETAAQANQQQSIAQTTLIAMEQRENENFEGTPGTPEGAIATAGLTTEDIANDEAPPVPAQPELSIITTAGEGTPATTIQSYATGDSFNDETQNLDTSAVIDDVITDTDAEAANDASFEEEIAEEAPGEDDSQSPDDAPGTDSEDSMADGTTADVEESDMDAPVDVARTSPSPTPLPAPVAADAGAPVEETDSDDAATGFFEPVPASESTEVADIGRTDTTPQDGISTTSGAAAQPESPDFADDERSRDFNITINENMTRILDAILKIIMAFAALTGAAS